MPPSRIPSYIREKGWILVEVHLKKSGHRQRAGVSILHQQLTLRWVVWMRKSMSGEVEYPTTGQMRPNVLVTAAGLKRVECERLLKIM
ncbi:unnamed protein product [Clonostachys chloroleuca]|uniref:Uncharacterized protein n=1 Tax=Clonostachys chloroleuca TaxID=1926264 RepID=A0AA35VBW7_9HYPO|nr:unnamed protein product [Clonostachys chloroleuca]